jgi:hypothetical protein
MSDSAYDAALEDATHIIKTAYWCDSDYLISYQHLSIAVLHVPSVRFSSTEHAIVRMGNGNASKE